ncbi:MAG: DUF5362 domain-containing protein [FCB group bacterium]|jgi:hypothetical protein
MDNNTPTPSQMYSSTPMNPFHFLILKMSKDMHFLGIIAIIYGIMSCLTIIGAAIGIPYIFAGMRLKESAEAFKNYVNINDQNILQQALEKQERFFYIMKILTIIGLVILGLYIIFIIAMIFVAGTTLFNHMKY